MTSIIRSDDLNTALRGLLMPAGAGRNLTTRIGMFEDYLAHTGQDWWLASLADYRDWLQKQRYTQNTVHAYVSSVASRYIALSKDNGLRDHLYSMTSPNLPLSDRKAAVDELIERIRNNADPRNRSVKTVTVQDYTDQQRRWLSHDELDYLLAAPGTDTLHGLRNTALLSLIAYTGIRSQEACDLIVDDLYQTVDGNYGLLIRKGKGAKQRVVFYGDYMPLALDPVDSWLMEAGIESGPVFRGVHHNGTSVYADAIVTKTVRNALSGYPLQDGYSVKAHDLRRTHAQMVYDNGMSLEMVSLRLGHSSIETTRKNYLKPNTVDGRVPRILTRQP